jgi:hypothetical protein
MRIANIANCGFEIRFGSGGYDMHRNRLLSLSALAITFICAANAQTVTVPDVPANLRVPAGHTAFLKGTAMGTQNYMCLPSETGLAWTFLAPQATVFMTFQWFGGNASQQILTHFLSPNPVEGGVARATWQSSLDTSSVWGKKIAESSDPAYVAPAAIPWFLLQAEGTQRGPMGGMTLAKTTYIQRINTAGGITPEGGCTGAGAMQFVPYSAEYVFYQADTPR